MARQWGPVRAALSQVSIRWPYVALSALFVFASYGVLIQAWRLLLGGWGARIGFWDGARIWTVSNLGKYVPGKVWQIGTMAVMAQQVGVPGVAAAGAALFSALITLGSGLAVVALTGARLLPVPGGAATLLGLVLVGLLLAPLLLPKAAALAARLTRREAVLPPLPASLIWAVFALSGAAWLLFGTGFHLLGLALTGAPLTSLTGSIAAFTASYLAGFLAFFAPGGSGVREVGMRAMLQVYGVPAATAIVMALASRLWLTVLEIGPALVFLVRNPARR